MTSLKIIFSVSILLLSVISCKKESKVVKPVSDMVNAVNGSNSVTSIVNCDIYTQFRSMTDYDVHTRYNGIITFQRKSGFYIPMYDDPTLNNVDATTSGLEIWPMENKYYPYNVKMLATSAPSSGNVMQVDPSMWLPEPAAPTGMGTAVKYKFYTSNPAHLGWQLDTQFTGLFDGRVVLGSQPNADSCPWIWVPSGFSGSHTFEILDPYFGPSHTYTMTIPLTLPAGIIFDVN